MSEYTRERKGRPDDAPWVALFYLSLNLNLNLLLLHEDLPD